METLPELLQRELLVVVGKGGVGKTTLSSAIALRSARCGRRTLLVTVDPAQRLADALGVPVGARVREVRPNLHAMMLDPEKVLEAYLRQVFSDRDVTGHPLYKYISNYMPGLNELIAIGKLIEFRRERNYDTIVVDTAPTGHALSFLTTPLKVRDLLRESLILKWAVRGYSVFSKVSRGGRALKGLFRAAEDLPPLPQIDLEEVMETLSREVGQIHALLQDAARTTLGIITLAEKLPVEETQTLHDYLRRELSIAVGFIAVNKVPPDSLEGLARVFDRFQKDADARRVVEDALDRSGYPRALLRTLVESAWFGEQRRQMNLEHLAVLMKRLPRVPKVMVPLLRMDVFGLSRLEELEVALFEAFEAARVETRRGA